MGESESDFVRPLNTPGRPVSLKTPAPPFYAVHGLLFRVKMSGGR